MKQLIVLVSLCLALPLFADNSPLTNTRTVYLGNLMPRARHDFERALKKELPQLRVVKHAKDADIMFQFTGTPMRDSGPSYVNVAVPRGQVNGQTETRNMPVPVSENSVHDPGHIEGYAVVHGTPVKLHEGLPSDAFSYQTAARFITAWRDANR